MLIFATNTLPADTNFRYLPLVFPDANNFITIVADTAANTMDWYYTAGGTVKLRQATVSDTGLHNYGLSWHVGRDRARAILDGEQTGADLTGLGTWVGALPVTATTCGAVDNTATSGQWVGTFASLMLFPHELDLRLFKQASILGGVT
jgi:hypothetical protein